MVDLAEFLLARIGEDEAVAGHCSGPGWRYRLCLGIDQVVDAADDDGFVATFDLDMDAMHAARWNPRRVLAECAAKRRVVEFEAGVTGVVEAVRQVVPVSGKPGTTVLRLLALPYADHPGYREEWRP
jgi:hypothetical protein